MLLASTLPVNAKSLTIETETEGTLAEKISETDKWEVTELKVSGPLNAFDFRTLREMSGCDLMGEPTEGKLKKLDCCEEVEEACPSAETPVVDPKRSIKEKSITCLECGKSFKLITKKHLAQHGLDADSYRRKWGIKSGVPLVCKSIQRGRRKKMKDMRLWEKRHPAAESDA